MIYVGWNKYLLEVLHGQWKWSELEFRLQEQIWRYRGGGGRDRGYGRGRGRGGGGDRFEERESLIKVGQVAPTFKNIMNDKSEPTSLEQYRGNYVVLFIFYKDGTYGCSEVQKAFRDAKSQFDKNNAVILGVSRDDVETHQKAIAEDRLNFTLLADTDGAISKAYGAIENDRVTRCTFLISPDGKVAAVWSTIYAFDKHPTEVARKLEEIKTGKASDNESKKNTDENEENEENQNENEDANEDADEDANEDEDDNEANEDDNADEDNDVNEDAE